ncbi:MAG: hypothetical protein ACI4O0_05040 [Candidatus Limivicinus sp.]
MKHPVLARVFSILLAILCLFMLLNGALGFGKADVALEESLAKYSRIEEKTDTYAALSRELENTVSYEEALAELEAMQEQHDDDAAQHRTDLATHTATMGGYELGAQMIQDGKEQLAAAKQELEEGKVQLAEKEQQLAQSREAFNAAKPALEQAIASSNGSDAEYQMALAIIDQMISEIDAALDSEPQNQATQEPREPVAPVAPEEPAPLAEDADDQAIADYDQAIADYNQAMQDYETKTDEYNQAMEEYTAAKDDYEQKLQEYQSAQATWQQQVQDTLASTDAKAAEADSRIQAGNAQRAAVLAQLPDDIAGGMGGSNVGMPDLSGMSLQERRAILVQVRQYLVESGNLTVALQGVLYGLESQLTQAEEALASAKRKVLLGEKALKRAEQELQHQLELIWYNMGQLEDEAEELEESKKRLDQESEELERRIVTVDEKKALENKHRSARIVLLQEGAIAAAVNAGGDLTECARTYVQTGREEAQYRHMMLYAVNALAIAGGLLGLLSIPGSFEKIKRRLLRILPTVLCLACALAADGLNMYLGLGQMYTALAAAIAAVFHLSTILPRNKTVVAG